MKHNFKKYVLAVVTVLLLVSVSNYVSLAAEKKDNALPYRDLTADLIREEMGVGWNLGNTMDGHAGFTPNEMVWQHVVTTKKLLKSVHDLGFNTVRIPVTWGTMIEDNNGYAINEAWMSRVQDIVDYAISQDMYVIVNMHHDGAEQAGWLRIATKDKNALYEKFGSVWEHIAERFKDYDEHLIFEAMNEVRGSGTDALQDNKVIMDLNQIFVDKIRATGSNNTKRWLVVTGKFNFIDSVTNKKNGFMLPKDTVKNRLIVSAHVYTPWNFCGLESTSVVEYSLEKLQKTNMRELKALYDTYTSKGIPVIVGEYGAINKNNPIERAYYLEGMNRMFQNYKLTGIYWDQGWFDRTRKPDYSFTIINRKTGIPVEKLITDAIIRGNFVEGAVNCEDIQKNTKVTKITEINNDTNSLSMTIGDITKINTSVEPTNTNDVVLWKTANSSVATVAYGKVRARGIGKTTITAYSQSGSVKKSIKVIVTAEDMENPCTEIITGKIEYQLITGDYEYLNAAAVPENSEAHFTYKSSDENVATVSTIGKIVAIGEGKAIITIAASSGIIKEVTVFAEAEKIKYEIPLALNVLYNDNSKDYYDNLISSQVITVTKNGQYTITFDCSTDLTKDAKASGITSLKNLTAIYIKDNNVSKGIATKSPLKSCNIKYDEIIVDGQKMTIMQRNPKSALKSSGVFDTNDPINAWNGSAIKEVKTGGNISNFSTIKNPTKITVTFTISELVFEDGAKAK